MSLSIESVLGSRPQVSLSQLVGWPMSIFVNLLGAGDLDEFRQLLGCFGRAFEEPRTYIERQPSDDYLIQLLGGGSFIAIAASCGATVVGGLAAYELRKFEQARSEIYLYDLAVSVQFRRKGVAKALIEALKRVASERGASLIFVQAHAEDEPAIRLYRQLGTRNKVWHFDIAVPQ